MTVGELVMAYACVERVLALHPTTMRVNSVRPMLLGACIIACKTSRDADLMLWQVATPPPAQPHPAPSRPAMPRHRPPAPPQIPRALPPGPWVRRPGETAHAIVCGQLSSVTVKSVERLELSM